MDKQMIIGVVGAGTMGAGIAQVAAQAGHTTYLLDTRPDAAQQALQGLRNTMDKLVAKGKLARTEADAVIARIHPATGISDLAPCGLVIEAIIEDLAVKQGLFRGLEAVVAPDALLASNTSSLPITAIAAGCAKPERVLGLHFFNPAPLMPLVEVVPGLATATDATSRGTALMRTWRKVPVTCKDTPGFIVNRVARTYYGESLRIFEEGIADMPTIDAAMRSAGFRMGPFELMDLIGNDINFTVTETVWRSFFHEPRYTPSLTQQRQMQSGALGRKTGRGFYDYSNGASAPHVEVEASIAAPIVERVLAMLINDAADARFRNIATAGDIELAMTKGVNYPKGLLAWGDEAGAAHWAQVMGDLYVRYGEERYRTSPFLRKVAQEKGSLLA